VSLRTSYHFVIAVWRTKKTKSARVKYWETIADNLSKAGWTWGCSSQIDSAGRELFTADAPRSANVLFFDRQRRKWGRIYIFDILAGDELNLDIF
jgi:hypothetical protein